MGKEPIGGGSGGGGNRPPGQQRGGAGKAGGGQPAGQSGARPVRTGKLKAPVTATGTVRPVGGAKAEPPKPLDYKVWAPPLTLAAGAAMVTVAVMGRPWAVLPTGLGFAVLGQSMLGRGPVQRRERVMRWVVGVGLLMFIGGMVVASQLAGRTRFSEPNWSGAGEPAKVVAPAEGE